MNSITNIVKLLVENPIYANLPLTERTIRDAINELEIRDTNELVEQVSLFLCEGDEQWM